MNWQWWLKSDAGLAARAAFGVSIFAAFAIIDFLRNGRGAQRWREYFFLAAVTTIAMLFGAINDVITASISWEYFYYGKGLSEQLGSPVPPDRIRLYPQAAWIGAQAAGAVGILAGALLLLAANPRPDSPKRSYQILFRRVGTILIAAAFGGVVGGVLGHFGLLTWTNNELVLLVRARLFRPSRFLCVYGIHLGEYVGGAIGTAAVMIQCLTRKQLQGGCTRPPFSVRKREGGRVHPPYVC